MSEGRLHTRLCINFVSNVLILRLRAVTSPAALRKLPCKLKRSFVFLNKAGVRSQPATLGCYSTHVKDSFSPHSKGPFNKRGLQNCFGRDVNSSGDQVRESCLLAACEAKSQVATRQPFEPVQGFPMSEKRTRGFISLTPSRYVVDTL